MTVELLQILMVVFLILAVLLGILTVILYITLGIRGIINDLNGTNAKKAIQDIRNRSRDENRSEYVRSSAFGHSLNYTDRMVSHGDTENTSTRKMREMAEALSTTAKLKNAQTEHYTSQLAETAQLAQNLTEYGNTTPLHQTEYGNTAALYQPDENQTTILNANNDMSETTLLDESMRSDRLRHLDFFIQDDLGFDENAEIIE